MVKKMNWNRIFKLIPVTALVLGLMLSSCETGVQEVEGNVGTNYVKAPQVGAVTVVKTVNKQYFIVSWDAVAGEGNYYNVYFKQDEKQSAVSIGSGQNQYKYDPATGNQIANDNLDKWSYRVSSLTASAAGSYCFGVRTDAGSYKVSTTSSDVKWADSVSVTAGSQISGVTAKVTTNGYVIVSWDGSDGAAYRVEWYPGSSSYYTYNYGQNSVTYSETDGNPSANTDPTKWSVRASPPEGNWYFIVYQTGVPDISILSNLPVKSNTVTK